MPTMSIKEMNERILLIRILAIEYAKNGKGAMMYNIGIADGLSKAARILEDDEYCKQLKDKVSK